MSDQRTQDEYLAMLTDQLLAQEDVIVPPEWEQEADVIRQLQQLTQPENIPADFRKRLTRRVYDEWDRTQEKKNVTPGRSSRMIPVRISRQVAILAAAFMMFTVVGVLVFNDSTLGGDDLGGTAIGPGQAFIVVAILGIVSSLLYIIWLRRR